MTQAGVECCGATSQGMQAASEAGTGKDGILPQTLWKEHNPANPLTLVP